MFPIPSWTNHKETWLMFVGHCITTQANSIIIPSKESYSEGGKRHRRLFHRPQNGFLDRGTASRSMQCNAASVVMATFFSWMMMISPFAATSLSFVLRFVRFSSCLQASVPSRSITKLGLRDSAVLSQRTARSRCSRCARTCCLLVV